MNLSKRHERARRKAKANRLERWNGVPQTASKLKTLRNAGNIFPAVSRGLTPMFHMQETGRFLRTIVIEAGQRVTRMIPILRRTKVEPDAS